jgi:hypothetical protein
MIKQCFGPSAGMRKRALAISAVVVVALAGLIGSASPAMATPKGKFAVFAQCPLTNPSVTACIFAQTKSGAFTIGKTSVPINKTITLQGGIIEGENEAEETTQSFVGAADGNTLSKTALNVPGGILGLVKCNEISNEAVRFLCELIFENGLTGVTATTELAAPATSIGINEGNLLDATGTALALPVKLKLSNPLLGEECYIGSNANPVHLNLTTGKSGTLTGKVGKVSVSEGLLTVAENSLVDGTFTAPAASGCGGIFSFLINPIINAKIGLPAGEGQNKAALEGQLEQAGVKTVKESE